jgi:hypothetical protein
LKYQENPEKPTPTHQVAIASFIFMSARATDGGSIGPKPCGRPCGLSGPEGEENVILVARIAIDLRANFELTRPDCSFSPDRLELFRTRT